MDYLSIKQISKELNISVITVRRHIKSGKLRAKRIGKEYRILRSDFKNFINPTAPNNFQARGVEKETISEPPKHFLNHHPKSEGLGNEPKHKHLQIFPGINSSIMETIMEMSGEMPLISDLKGVIEEHAKECLSLINKIEEEGITDTQVAVNLLLIDEAIKNLTIRRNLFMRLIERKAIILLPLPPHLSDPTLTIAHNDLVFIVDRNLPPHLRHAHYKNMDFIPPSDLDKLTEGIEAIVLEGYVENKMIYIRQNASNLIYQLCLSGLKDIFIHSIPHIPPHSRFVELNTRGVSINIMTV